MFLRCTRAQFDPAKADEVMVTASDLKAALDRLPGIQHSHGAIDREAGRTITITIFDTREHAQFSRDALGDLNPRFQAAGMTMAAPEVYETL